MDAVQQVEKVRVEDWLLPKGHKRWWQDVDEEDCFRYVHWIGARGLAGPRSAPSLRMRLRCWYEIVIETAGANASCSARRDCAATTAAPRDVRAVMRLAGADARAVLERLAVQGLVSPLEGTETPVFVVTEHLRGRLGLTDQVSDQADAGPLALVTDQAGAKQDDLSTAQVPSRQEDLSTTYAHKWSGKFTTQAEPDSSTAYVEPLTELSGTHWRIAAVCDVPRSLTEIMNALGVAGRGYFKRRHLDPLLRGGVLRMTHPEQPRHPGQAYVLTEAGVALKSRRVKEDAGTGNGGRTNGPQQAG